MPRGNAPQGVPYVSDSVTLSFTSTIVRLRNTNSDSGLLLLSELRARHAPGSQVGEGWVSAAASFAACPILGLVSGVWGR
eukprot:4928125-Prymnesium_polylepis.1